jgi:hypothetical protein
MNEKLMETADKALVELLDVFIKTKDFAIEQAPDVVQQLLVWKFTISLLCFVITLATPALFLAVTHYLAKKNNDSSFYLPNMSLVLLIIPVSNGHIIDWLQIWLAPKVWLIEYAASLVK